MIKTAIHLILPISLMITGLHIAFQSGNVLSPVRAWVATVLDHILGTKWSRYVQKPLWDCLPCMASIWGALLAWTLNPFTLLAICGMNVIIERVIDRGDLVVGVVGESAPSASAPCAQVTEYHDDIPTLRTQRNAGGNP